MNEQYNHSENSADHDHEMKTETGYRSRRSYRNNGMSNVNPSGDTIPERNLYRQDTENQRITRKEYRQRNNMDQSAAVQIPPKNGYEPTGGSYSVTQNSNLQTTGEQIPIKETYKQTTPHMFPVSDGYGQQTGEQNPINAGIGQSTGEHIPLKKEYDQPSGSMKRNRPLADWQTDPSMRAVNSWTQTEEAMSGFNRYDVDPNIAQDRSPNLYDKDNNFWKKDSDKKGKETKVHNVKTVSAASFIKIVVVLVALLIVAAVIARNTIFSVNEITVKGNEAYSAEDIIKWSGIRKGMYLLTVNKSDVEKNLSIEPHIELDYVEKEVPGRVTIAINERKPVAFFNDCGILYTVDKSRMVLDMSEDMNSQFNGLFELKGLSLQDTRVGLKLQLSNEAQGVVWESLVREIRVMQLLPMIQEMNLNDMKSIRLMTKEGYTIIMGDGQDIHAKLRAMTLVREKLISMGLLKGIIDVSDYEHPVYIPTV